MSGMSAWDHSKISENSCISDKKELTPSCGREFPKLTCSGLGRIVDAAIVARGFWDHHAWLGRPRFVVVIWSACHLSSV